MEVTELGMVTEVSPEQPRKASSPMEVTEYVAPLYAIVSGMTISPLYLLLYIQPTLAVLSYLSRI